MCMICMALITTMALCALSQELLVSFSGSVRGATYRVSYSIAAHVKLEHEISMPGLKSGGKPCHKARETSAMRDSCFGTNLRAL